MLLSQLNTPRPTAMMIALTDWSTRQLHTNKGNNLVAIKSDILVTESS